MDPLQMWNIVWELYINEILHSFHTSYLNEQRFWQNDGIILKEGIIKVSIMRINVFVTFGISFDRLKSWEIRSS